VYGEKKMFLLSSYKDWLISLYKTNQKSFTAKRAHMKYILLKGIFIELPQLTDRNSSTEVSDNIVYYTGGGYLVLPGLHVFILNLVQHSFGLLVLGKRINALVV
jgi:hypothetical protein